MAKFNVEQVRVFVYEDNYVRPFKEWFDISYMVNEGIKKEFIDALNDIEDEILNKENEWVEEYVKQYGEPLFAWDSTRYGDFLRRKIVSAVHEKRVNNFELRTMDGCEIYGMLIHKSSDWGELASRHIKFVYKNK